MDTFRYRRQVLLKGIGEEGQRRLRQGRATIVGVGALGAMSATLLVRAGVGFIRLVDRDIVRLDNLHRQVLYDEEDVALAIPKAEAARRHLSRVNSEVEIEAIVADFNRENAISIAQGADVLIDGCDSFESRFLLNEASVRLRIPFIHGAVLGSYGVQASFLPGRGCLACVVAEALGPGAIPTCETVGVFSPTVVTVAALQVAEAIKVLAGHGDQVRRSIYSFDLWTGERAEVALVQDPDCPVCGHGRFDYLEGRKGSFTEVLCGSEAVQIRLGGPMPRWETIEEGLDPAFRVKKNPYMMAVRVGDLDITLFPDGRAIVRGTGDPKVARAVLSRLVGT